VNLIGEIATADMEYGHPFAEKATWCWQRFHAKAPTRARPVITVSEERRESWMGLVAERAPR